MDDAADPMLTEITSRRIGDAAVVGVCGECDVAVVPELRSVLAAELESRPAVLVVDLSETTFVDSTCLGAIVATFRKAQESGFVLRVVADAYDVRQPFEITGLGRVLTLHRSLDEALGVAEPSRAE